jgi:hypothetical protein
MRLAFLEPGRRIHPHGLRVTALNDLGRLLMRKVPSA